MGKPVLQSLLFDELTFKNTFLLDFPPIVHVSDEEKLLPELFKLIRNANLRREIGLKGSRWYSKQIESRVVDSWIQEIITCKH